MFLPDFKNICSWDFVFTRMGQMFKHQMIFTQVLQGISYKISMSKQKVTREAWAHTDTQCCTDTEITAWNHYEDLPQRICLKDLETAGLSQTGSALYWALWLLLSSNQKPVFAHRNLHNHKQLAILFLFSYLVLTTEHITLQELQECPACLSLIASTAYCF